MDAAGALVRAAADGDAGAVLEQLRSGVPADAADANGRRALDAAAQHGRLDVVALLLERGAVPHGDGDGPQPIHLAIYGGHAAVVELLLDAGAPVNAPFDANIGSNDRWLGNRVWWFGTVGCSALHVAAGRGHLTVVLLLLRAGAAVGARSADGEQPLHSAARNGHAKVVRALLDHGAAIDAAGRCDSTPLIAAAMYGRAATVKLLLSCGADVGAVDDTGRQAIHCAACDGHTPVARQLLDDGADLEAEDDHGWRPIHYAANGGHLGTLELLLARRAGVGPQDEQGEQPVHKAVAFGRYPAVELLVSRGARIDDAPGLEGLHIAMAWAAQRGHAAVLEAVFRHGAVLGGEPAEGARRALLAALSVVAVRTGRAKVLRVLLRHASGALVAAPHGGAHVHALIGAWFFGQAEALLAAGAELPSPEGLGAEEAAARRGFELWLRLAPAHARQEREEAWQLLLGAACEANRLERGREAAPSAGVHNAQQPPSLAAGGRAASPHGGADVRALISARLFREADALLAVGAELPPPKCLGAEEAAARNGFTLWLREARARVGQERAAARRLLLAATGEASRLERARGGGGAAPSAGAHNAQQPPSLPAGPERAPLHPGAGGAGGWPGAALTAAWWLGCALAVVLALGLAVGVWSPGCLAV
jgi:ankyrin repeat protein